MLVDLAHLPILPQQPPEDSLPPHPQELRRHPRIPGTLALSRTGVAAFTFGLHKQAMAGGGVDDLRLDDDLSIADEFADISARVGSLDLGLLRWVEPDLSLANARDGGSETFLHSEIHGGLMEGVSL